MACFVATYLQLSDCKESSIWMKRNLGDRNNKADQKHKNNDDDSNSKKNNNDDSKSKKNDDDKYYYIGSEESTDDQLCIDQNSPFNVENKNVVIRCSDLKNSDKKFACSWPGVSRKCPCNCRGHNSDADYDDVFNYGNTPSQNNDDDFGHGIVRGRCENVNHPFSIYKDYQKVLVYCSDLETEAYQYACNRDRPRRKCPGSCLHSCGISNGDDKYKDDTYDDDKYDDDDSSSCKDASNAFQIIHNKETITIRCTNLLQKQFVKNGSCERKLVRAKCPVSCGACPSFTNDDGDDFTNGYLNDDDFTNGYADDYKNGFIDDFTNGYADDFTNGYADDFTNGYRDDFTQGYSDDEYYKNNNGINYNNNGYNNNINNNKDDDYNIIYFDDNGPF